MVNCQPAFLMAGMLAGHAIEPAFDAAGEQEVILVDGQHAALHDDALEQPVGEREGHAGGLAGLLVGHLGPALQPVERGGLLLALGADVGAHGGVGEPVEGGAEPLVMLAAGRPADRL